MYKILQEEACTTEMSEQKLEQENEFFRFGGSVFFFLEMMNDLRRIWNMQKKAYSIKGSCFIPDNGGH